MSIQEKYLQTQVEMASPGLLITMMYDGGIRFLRQAKANLSSNRLQEANYFLIRAENVIAELNNCLDMSRGEISTSLRQLYEYMLTRLTQANAGKDATMIDEVIVMLQELREAWTQSVASA